MAESKQAQSPLPVAQDHEDATPQRSRRGLDSRSFIAGLCIALTINGGGLLALWWTVRHPETKPTKVAEVYVDAKLVKFGKKRDMSWLPHVPVSPKTVEKPNTLKLAIDPNKPVVKKDEPKRNEDLSKLADKLKNLRTDEDDRARSTCHRGRRSERSTRRVGARGLRRSVHPADHGGGGGAVDGADDADAGGAGAAVGQCLPDHRRGRHPDQLSHRRALGEQLF
jgi:hypothetical protein